MVDDPAAAIVKINAFMGRPALSDATLQRVLEQTSMTHMQKHASIGLNHLRKGGYGGWRSTFTVEQSELFDEVYELKMAPLAGKLRFNFGPNSKGEAQVM